MVRQLAAQEAVVCITCMSMHMHMPLADTKHWLGDIAVSANAC